MKILHAPSNIAGQPYIISRGQRALGHTSDVLVLDSDKYSYGHDINLHITNKKLPSRLIAYIRNVVVTYRTYDIFHFHFGLSLLPHNIDLRFLKKCNKKVVMHYWGSDVIQTDIAPHYTDLDAKTMSEIYPLMNNERKRKQLKWVEQHVQATIVGDYSLLPYSPNSLVVRQAFDIDQHKYVPTQKNDVVTVIHAPTNRKIKGTAYIIKVIERLKKRYQIEFRIIENTPHEEALKLYESADIIVDDVMQGPYGIFAIECMALGKPILARVDSKLAHYYPELPIVNSDRETLYSNLERLITNEQLRKEIGMRGRRYVEKYHDYRTIAKQLISLYCSF